MARSFVASFIIAALVLGCGMAYSQSIVDEHPLATVEGRVLEVNSAGSRITIMAVDKMTFAVPIDAVIKQDIFDIKLSDVKSGDYVTISYDGAGPRKYKARQITVHYNDGEGT